MSVLIKGMQIPYGCARCEFVSDPKYTLKGMATYSCNVPVNSAMGTDVTDETLNMYEGGGGKYRPEWCPLIEIPDKHGRLIDENDVIKMLDKGWKAGIYPSSGNIHALKAVVEAEGVDG